MIIRELKREIERLEELKKQIKPKQGNAKAGQAIEKLTCKRKKCYYQYYIDEKYVSKKKALKKLVIFYIRKVMINQKMIIKILKMNLNIF